MSDDETFADDAEQPALCTVCGLHTWEYRVCTECDCKAGLDCSTLRADGSAVCNDCKETP